MSGLFNGKQVREKTVGPEKLTEEYLNVNGGEISGDLTVSGNTALSETSTYKGVEIATHSDLYDDTEVRDLIDTKADKSNVYTKPEIDEKFDDLISGETGLSNYYTKEEADNLLDTKQDNLEAGANIQINGLVISATDTIYNDSELRGIVSNLDEIKADKSDTYTIEEVDSLLNEKQSNLTAGDNIVISDDNIISSSTPIALSDEVLTYDSAGLKANISVVVNGNNVKVEGKTGEDGEPIVIGEFNVLQSQIIQDVEIVNGHLLITFIIDGDPGTETVDIDLSEFIDVYVGSQYIDIEGNQISLDYDSLYDELINEGFAKIGDIPGQIDTSDFARLSVAQIMTGSKNFTGGITKNGVDVATINDIPTIPQKLPNPYSITFTGGATGSYDGSGAITINIPVAITDYVSIAGTQTITGNKNFTGTLTKSGVSVATINDIPAPIDTSNFATLNTSQTFTGAKNFNSTLTKNGVNVATVNDLYDDTSVRSLITSLQNTKADKTEIPNTANFVQTSGAQTVNGVKTFGNIPVFNAGSVNIKTSSVAGGSIIAKSNGIYTDGAFAAKEIRSGTYDRSAGTGVGTEIYTSTTGKATISSYENTGTRGLILDLRDPKGYIQMTYNDDNNGISKIFTDKSLYVQCAPVFNVNCNSIELLSTTRPTWNGTQIALVSDVSRSAVSSASHLSDSVSESVLNPSVLNLSENTDIRYTNTERKTGTLKISGGIDGKEYRYSILNKAGNDLSLTLPDGAKWVIPSGNVGILKIYCLFDRYICRIV